MRVLITATADWALIAIKVSLGDLFYVQTGDYSQNRVYRNKIDRKHIDFLLYDPQTLQPILGIELDDKSHERKDRQERDRFVDGVFAAAGLPIAHIPVRPIYQATQLNQFLRQFVGSVTSEARMEASAAIPEAEEPAAPNCPDCGRQMVLRTATRGPNTGNQFWGCSDYPRCRGIRPNSVL